MPQVTLQCEPRRALKIAVFLREIEYVLQLVHQGKLPEAEGTEEAMERRQEMLLFLARTLETAVKDQSPELPAHQRPASHKVKQVWCEGGCQTALSLEQMRQSPFCQNCRRRAEAGE